MNGNEQDRKEETSTDRVPHSTCNSPAGGARAAWVFWGFLAIAGFFLLTEHRAHVFGVLPLLLLAAAARDAGARSVGLVAPYLACMRQDR